ncbi:MAG: PD-(D/E)XK nuclease family transposase, partial [Mariprofundaceae bacterium]|nr:PD-(D/E)XK nuclease family transposase [Mariprofundaceae bacterium]
FDFGTGDDYIYKGTTNFIGLHNKSLLQLNEKQQQLYKTTKVEKLYPEFYLIKIKNFNDHSKDTLDEWINFLKNEEISDHPKAKGLLKAKETLDYLKMEEHERLDYNQYQKSLHDQASAYESTYVIGKIEGKIEGAKQVKINIATKLFKANVDIDTIKLTTGLTDMELKKFCLIKDDVGVKK